MARKIKSLYEIFSNNSKKEIDGVINNLSPVEKQIVLERYGNDLENPRQAINWSVGKNNIFYGNIYPKIKRILNQMANNYLKVGGEVEVPSTIYEILGNYSKKQIDYAFSLLCEEDKEIIRKRYGEDFNTPTFSAIMTDEEKQIFKAVVKKLENNLKNQEIKTKKENKGIVVSSIFSIPLKGYTQEEIEIMTSELTSEELLLLTDPQNETFQNYNTRQRHFCIQDLTYKMLIILRRNKNANLSAPKPVEAPQVEESKPVEAPQVEEPKPVETPQVEEPKPVEAPQVEESKRVEAPQVEEPKPVEAPQVEESKPVEASQVKEPKPVEAQQKSLIDGSHYAEKDSQEEYHHEMLQKYLTNPTFLNELKSLSCEKITIVSLKYGLASKHCFSIEEISIILDLPVEYIVDVLRSFLNGYKAKVNAAIENAINTAIYDDGHCRQGR